MSKLLALLLIPAALFGAEPVYTLSAGSTAFMVISFAAIIAWNVVCFTKIIAQDKKSQ